MSNQAGPHAKARRRKGRELDFLWEEFNKNRASIALRNRLVAAYFPLLLSHAHRMAFHFHKRIELGDLIGWGAIGLIRAIRDFDPARGALFETFSARPIRGAMLDGMREYDPCGRWMRQNARRFERAVDRLTQRFGRTPSAEETAAELGVSLERLERYARESTRCQTMSLDAPWNPGGDSGETCWRDLLAAADGDCTFVARRHEFMDTVREHVSPREWRILRDYYARGWTFARIGAAIGCGESNVSVLHQNVLVRLRSRLAGLEDEFQ